MAFAQTLRIFRKIMLADSVDFETLILGHPPRFLGEIRNCVYRNYVLTRIDRNFIKYLDKYLHEIISKVLSCRISGVVNLASTSLYNCDIVCPWSSTVDMSTLSGDGIFRASIW